MNSKFLLVAVLGCALHVQAQVNTSTQKGSDAQHMLSRSGQEKETIRQTGLLRTAPAETPVSPAAITILDTLYSFDFSNQDSIVISPSSGANGYWVIGTYDQIGPGVFNIFEDSLFASTTADNGYAMFNSLDFPDATRHNANLTIGPILNIPAAAGEATLNFEQRYARLDDTTSIWVSNDGINFTKLGDNMNIRRNLATANPQLKSVRITDFLGKDSLYIRFNYRGADDYSWLIDDITITESELSGIDIAIESLQNGNFITKYNYTHIPLTQVDSIGITLIVRNHGDRQGAFTISYDIIRGEDTLHSGSYAQAITLAPQQGDTLAFTTAYVPSDTGTYRVRVELNVADNGDDVPLNNVQSINQAITQYLYSPVPTSMGPFSYTLQTSGPPYAYYYVAQNFVIHEDQDVYGIQAAIARSSTGFTGTQDLELAIYETESTTHRPVTDPISSAIISFRVDESHPPATQGYIWKDHIFDRPVRLEAGKTYAASINAYESNNVFWFGAINDGDLDGGTWFFSQPEGQTSYGWYRLSLNLVGSSQTGIRLSPGIRLNFDPALRVGIKNVESGVRLEAFPVPASNYLNVRIIQEKPSAFELRMTDLNGRVVYQKAGSSQSDVYNEQISLDRIADGFYTLQFVSADGISTRKVVIAR